MNYLFTDGGSRGNPGNAACAFYIFDENELVDFGGKFLDKATNNVAEYSGLVLGLKAAQKLGIKELEVKMDSELIIKQIKGEYKVSSPEMKKLITKVFELNEEFDQISFTHIRRELNKFADKMVNIILDNVELVISN